MQKIRAIFDGTKPSSIKVSIANGQELTLSGNFEADVEDGAIITSVQYVDGYNVSINEYTATYTTKSAEQVKQERIDELKRKLNETDYIYAKCTETGEDVNVVYAEVIANRKAWRKEVQELEGE